MNYDPMTGQPVQQGPQMNYDPMTGQPMQQGPQVNFGPMTGQPVSGKKKHKGVIAAVIAAVVVVAAGGTVFAGVKSGAFLGKSGKVLLATAKTFSESSMLMDNLEGLSLMESKSFTMEMDMNIEGNSIDATLSSNNSEKQISGTANFEDVPSIEFLAGIDSDEVKAQIPMLGDTVFVYNYQKEKTGYLAEELGEDGIASIDQLCETLYSSKEQTQQQKELSKILSKQYKELEFRSVNKETFEIDGKDRKCKGYETTVTSDFMLDLCDNLEDYVYEEAGDLLRESGYDADAFDELRDDFRDMPDIDFTFYIYRGKLACIEMEAEGDELQVIFHGGKTRMQNMEVVSNGYSLMEIEGQTNGSVEESRLYMNGQRVGGFEYDGKTGDYELTVENGLEFDGRLKTDRNSFQFSCNGEGMNLSIELKKGATMQKIEGDELDIGNASEMELQNSLSGLYY